MFFDNLCSRCSACADACPNGCIAIKNGDRVYSSANCQMCGSCQGICPNNAIKMVGEKMSVEEVVSVAEKDYLFYLNSGGGVTLGGGEPTMQAEFALELLKELKALGIHTAMETCGYSEWSVFKQLIPNLDLLLYDVKHIDPAIHSRHTGKSNERIMKNLKKILKGETPVIIRIPVIPGFNNNVRTMKDIALFLNRHNSNRAIERVDLLPYHKLGIGKYEALGCIYKMEGCQTPGDESMEGLKQIFIEQGFDTFIELL